MSFEKFLLAVESHDLSQADKSITGVPRLMRISLARISLWQSFKTFHKYLAYVFLGLFISLLQFLCYKQNIEKIAVMK
jgi:hypothetical protein